MSFNNFLTKKQAMHIFSVILEIEDSCLKTVEVKCESRRNRRRNKNKRGRGRGRGRRNKQCRVTAHDVGRIIDIVSVTKSEGSVCSIKDYRVTKNRRNPRVVVRRSCGGSFIVRYAVKGKFNRQECNNRTK